MIVDLHKIKNMGIQKNINKHSAKVISCLISNGYYPPYFFEINRYDAYCDLDITQILISPYSKLRIYEDGIIQYFDSEGTLQFEGSTKYVNSIMKDILNK